MDAEVIYNVQPGFYWDWRVAADLFLGGAGVGALLFAIGIDERFKGKYHRVSQTASWLSPILICMGLVLLMMKMGRPFHIYETMLNVNLSSPLWWGGVLQPLLILGSLYYAFQWTASSEQNGGRLVVGRILAPLALLVGTYHGLLLAINTSRPLWNNGPTVFAAILGFVTTGIAVVAIVHLTRMKMSGELDNSNELGELLADMGVVRNILIAAIVLQLGTFGFWWFSLRFGSLQDQQALAAASEVYSPLFWSVGIGIGLVIPLALGGIGAIRAQIANPKLQVNIIMLTSMMILCGGYVFRLAVILGGQVDLPVQTLP